MHTAALYRLRPGVVPVRRDASHVQLGLDPPERVVLRDGEDVRRLLRELVEGCPPPQALAARRAFDALLGAGLLLGPPREAGAGPGISVEGPADLVAAFAPLLAPAAVTAPADAGVVVLLSAGPLDRARADPLLRTGTPHLVVEADAARWTVGPFVVPGATACVRCVDASLAEDDPRRGLVLEQLVRRGVRPPLDPLLQAVALPWAARDVLAYLAGEAPTTWSATRVFGRAGEPLVRSWPRHPRCGCAWDQLGAG